MTRAGTIPLSDIARIQIYAGKVRNSKSGLKSILKKTGGTFVMGGPVFLRTFNACCHLSIDGEVIFDPGYQAWCISWNKPADFCVEPVSYKKVNKANYIECVHLIIDGKKIDPINCGTDMKYACNRVAVGVKEGRFAYYATEDNLTPEQLRDILFSAGWSDAIMMDGGGSACFLDENGDGFAGDGRYMPFYIVIKLREKDIELKGEKPVEFEIKVYSLEKEGSKYLTKNFQVREFRCKDGSDTIFVAVKLPMICQYIRMRCGKGLTINSAYRTPEHNAKEGGEEFSMHLYGAAADLKCPAGLTPKQMAGFAREIMPDWGGVGIYSWGIHVDVSPVFRNWNG